MNTANEPSGASALGAGLLWPLRRRPFFLVATVARLTSPVHSSDGEERTRNAQASRTAVAMVGARSEKELIRRSPESPRLEAIVLQATPTRRTPWQQSRRKVMRRS
jgi:hypothetical protein